MRYLDAFSEFSAVPFPLVFLVDFAFLFIYSVSKVKIAVCASFPHQHNASFWKLLFNVFFEKAQRRVPASNLQFTYAQLIDALT